MRVVHTILTMGWILGVIGLLGCSDPYEQERIKEIVEQQSRQPVDEYTLFRAPSYPRKIERVIPEWKPVEALVVGLPYEDAIANPALFDFYEAIIKNAIRCTDVILLVDERELIAFQEILYRIQAGELNRYLQTGESQRIILLPARLNTKWIRDYGPFFVTDKQHRIFVTDAVYRDVRVANEQTYTFDSSFSAPLADVFGNVELGQAESMERNEDDSAAMYLVYHLNRRHENEVQNIRVPFQLCGGEIFFDGMGDVFLTSESLFINGGHRTDVELLLKYYYGMKNITYLDPLPGDAIKHLDMIFKPVNETTFLVAEYPNDVTDENPYLHYLHNETRRILDNDAALLQRRFPNRRVVRMPMPAFERISKLPSYALQLTLHLFESGGYTIPAPLTETPERWTLRRFAYFVYTLQKIGEYTESDQPAIIFDILKKDDSRRFVNEEEALLNQLVSKLLDDHPDLIQWIIESCRENVKNKTSEYAVTEEELSRFMIGNVFNGAEEEPGNYDYIFRTYLNATYINGASGKILLVPGYTGYEEMEGTVRQIYQDLYPDAEIVFINSDEIILQDGTIHCVTLTIPAFSEMEK
ncbi:MAG: hypothetical protein C4527_23180 [Candidatus Omnitrophota bacterium]|jgi:agmatine/peptidylarginine deiminase|nr:MAG: hypothetical protein C4527_23180 [Candidatus Omnitrophota bacterium]